MDFGWHPVRTTTRTSWTWTSPCCYPTRATPRTRRSCPFRCPTRRRARAWTCAARTRPRTWMTRTCPPCHPTRRIPRTRITLAWAAPVCREKAVWPDATKAWFSSEHQDGEGSGIWTDFWKVFPAESHSLDTHCLECGSSLEWREGMERNNCSSHCAGLPPFKVLIASRLSIYQINNSNLNWGKQQL